MVIDVIDVTDPLLTRTQVALERLGRSKILTYCSMSNGVGQMVVDICRLLSWKQIEALRIWGHGDIGGQNISAGTDGSGVVAHRTGLSPAVASEERAVLERLTPYFMPNARVELRGCAVGRGADGVAFLKRLADIWKVNVIGAVELQPGTGLDWYGPVYEVGKNGARFGSGPKI